MHQHHNYYYSNYGLKNVIEIRFLKWSALLWSLKQL